MHVINPQGNVLRCVERHPGHILVDHNVLDFPVGRDAVRVGERERLDTRHQLVDALVAVIAVIETRFDGSAGRPRRRIVIGVGETGGPVVIKEPHLRRFPNRASRRWGS